MRAVNSIRNNHISACAMVFSNCHFPVCNYIVIFICRSFNLCILNAIRFLLLFITLPFILHLIFIFRSYCTFFISRCCNFIILRHYRFICLSRFSCCLLTALYTHCVRFCCFRSIDHPGVCHQQSCCQYCRNQPFPHSFSLLNAVR